MAKYIYVCDFCKYRDEIEISINSDIPKEYTCPICGKGKFQRDWVSEISSQEVRIPHNFRAQISNNKRGRKK